MQNVIVRTKKLLTPANTETVHLRVTLTCNPLDSIGTELHLRSTSANSPKIPSRCFEYPTKSLATSTGDSPSVESGKPTNQVQFSKNCRDRQKNCERLKIRYGDRRTWRTGSAVSDTEGEDKKYAFASSS